MLILTRKIGEAIKISDNITVVVLGVKGSQVRLGIEAPQGVAVDRKEIAERKAAGLTKPTASGERTGSGEPETLYGNRTEDEWRQLLQAEAEEQAARESESGHEAA